MNFKKLFLFTLFCLPIFVFAQATHKLSDYGLTPEQAKELTSQQIKEILSQPTPDEIFKGMDEADKNGIKYTFPKGYPTQIVPDPKLPDDVINCFDYYKFNSVQIDFYLSTTTLKAGETAHFTGTIKNENNYPIVNGLLYVKVVEGGFTKNNLNKIIDEFIPVKNIIITANGQNNFNFDWKVPQYSESGKYNLIGYFIVDDKFPLLGLNFNEDTVGSIYTFEIINGNNNIYFDRNNIKLNNHVFRTDILPEEISTGTPALFTTKIVNDTDKDENIKVISRLYKWDSVDPKNFVKEITKDVFVKAKSTTNYEVNISEDEYSVYYLVEELVYKDTKSILPLRFVRSGVDKLKFDFLSTYNYPITKNSTTTIFSCLHNTGSSITVDGGVFDLKLLDKNGKLINEYRYDGPITTKVMGLKKDFVSNKELKDFSIEATLWQGGKIIDHSIMKYSCEDLTPGKCSNNFTLFLLLILGGILLIIVVLLVNKKNK